MPQRLEDRGDIHFVASRLGKCARGRCPRFLGARSGRSAVRVIPPFWRDLRLSLFSQPLTNKLAYGVGQVDKEMFFTIGDMFISMFELGHEMPRSHSSVLDLRMIHIRLALPKTRPSANPMDGSDDWERAEVTSRQQETREIAINLMHNANVTAPFVETSQERHACLHRS